MIIDKDSNLSKNFKISEFSCPAVIDGKIRNDLDRHVIINMDLVNKLQQLRDFYKKPIKITAYRSPEYNAIVPGASKNSYHIKGKAADFHIDGVPMIDLYNKCISIGFSGVGIYDTWVHADVGDTIRRWDNRSHCSAYEKIGLTHITWINPLSIMAKASFAKTGKECAEDYPNFINGQYFWWNDGFYTIGWQFSEGEPTHDNFLSYDEEYAGLFPRKRGTFIVYKDGNVEVKNISNSKLKDIRDNIFFCLQGFNLFPLDLEAEGYTSCDSLTRMCRRHGIGFNPNKGICIVARPLTSATRLVKTMQNLGCTMAIGLDSGKTANEKMNGNNIHVNNEYLSNILYWR